MTGAGGRRDDDEPGGQSEGVTNVVHGDVSGSVIQVGSVSGGMHQHFQFVVPVGPVEATRVGPTDQDPESDGHWGPRARGVMSNAEIGQRFRGRETALRKIITWLDRPESDRRVLVVTGSPGAGKSAVLARIVVTAYHATHDSPADHRRIGDDGPRATAGSVNCAVHAKGKTALDVAREIARATSARTPDQPEDLPGALRSVLVKKGGRFNLIIDAVDEASDPTQARLIASDVIRPIAIHCADVGAQVVVGTRRFAGDRDLLRVFVPGATVIDLDEPAYFAVADLAAYAQATLQLSGAEREDNPYSDEEVAGPVALRIAELAGKNFLIAGLVASTHGLWDRHAAPVDQIRFTPSVADALDAFLSRLPPVEGVAPVDLLAALAYVQAPGVPLGLWQVAVSVLSGQTIFDRALRRFAQKSAANFLIETTDVGTAGSVFRLFHQALNDALLHGEPADGEAPVAKAFIAVGREHGWDRAPAYLLRSLPNHAARVSMVDDLLTDPDYILHADLRRLILASAAATTEAGARTVQLLRRTPDATDATSAQRLALFSVTEALDSTDTTYRGHRGRAPYRAVWANTTPRVERAILSGHTGPVVQVCTVRVDGWDLLATASHDATVRIWDPTTGTPLRVLRGHTAGVRALCALRVEDRDLLATASDDDTVRIWDPATGTPLHRLGGYTTPVVRLCAVGVGGRDLLATASYQTVRIWDPATGTSLHRLDGHIGVLPMVCAVQVDGRDLLATASPGGVVRIWDPATGAPIRDFGGDTRQLVRVGRGLLATASEGTVRIWDPATGTPLHRLDGILDLDGHTHGVGGPYAVRVGGRDLLAIPILGGTVRIWDPASRSPERELTGHHNNLEGVCAVRVDSQDMLATASHDATVRTWHPVTGAQLRCLDGHTDAVRGVCVVRVDDKDLLATASDDRTVRIWDPATGTPERELTGCLGAVKRMCAVRMGGRDLLATASDDHTVRIWDPATGTPLRVLSGHTAEVRAVCAVRVDSQDMLASTSDDWTVRIWDPTTGTQLRALSSYPDKAREVCAVRVNGRDLLAAADIATVLLWDPATGTKLRELTSHDFHVCNVCAVSVDGRELLATATYGGAVQMWDPATGTRLTRLGGGPNVGKAGVVCAVRVDGRDLLVTAGHDATVRIWDPATGTELRTLTGHTGLVKEVCAVQMDGRNLLATASYDGSVRIWDLTTGNQVARVPTYAHAYAVISIAARLFVRLRNGLLAIDLSRDIDRTV